MSANDTEGGTAFEVTWNEPWEQKLTWRHERWHTPYVISPLGFDVMDQVIYGGFRQGLANKEAPYRPVFKRVNGYVYMATRRPFDHELVTTEELPPAEDRLDHWDDAWLPEVQAILERLAAFDREEATDAELGAHLEREIVHVQRGWAIHQAIEFYQGQLVDFCAEHLDLDEAGATRLVQALPNKSLEADSALRALSVVAAAAPEVRAALEAADPLPALRATPAAAGFLGGLADYLDEWGRRSDNFVEMAIPSWTEDPATVFSLIRMCMAAPRDVEADRTRLAEERERAVQDAREGVPADQREPFELALERAQRGAMLNEDHNYWIDQQMMHWLRQTLIEIGRRLADRGAIEAPNDVAMMYLDEVRTALAAADDDRMPLVDERRAEMDAWSQLDAPPMLGRPTPAPAEHERMFGLGAELRERNEASRTTIRGQAASQGTHRGIARVITSIVEGDRIGPGDVLVTATTSPPWTPLFGAASAVVTDAGGSLSHAAIVAREYGIPAVVGTANATSLIADGALIEVDGTAGEVRVIGGNGTSAEAAPA